ncbi:MAG: head decoration protein [Oscillospiraceae bacterium]|nr:head decoration protein [Oscillospiraceae bacterium]
MATRDLHEKIGSVEFEKLFAGMQPREMTHAATIRKLSTAATMKRGTLLAKSSGSGGDGKLVIFGTTAATNETLTPDCVLCNDIEVGTTNDENALVYIAGNFNEAALIMATGASLTEADRDALRERGIILGTIQEP